MSISGLKISEKDLNIVFSKIKRNLKYLEKKPNDEILKIVVEKNNKSFLQNDYGYSKKIKRKLIFYSKNFKSYEKCDIFGLNCELINLKKNDKKKLINQSLEDREKNKLIFVGKRKYDKQNKEWFYQNHKLNPKYIQIANSVKILMIGNPSINVNEINKEITIKKNNYKDKVVFKWSA